MILLARKISGGDRDAQSCMDVKRKLTKRSNKAALWSLVVSLCPSSIFGTSTGPTQAKVGEV